MSAKSLIATAENGVWRNIQGEWRQLFGSFSREGISIEYHHFRSEKELDWGRSFHEDSLEICLNLQGTGVLRRGRENDLLGVRNVAYYLPGRGREFIATRTPGEHHHFVTLEMSRGYLLRHLSVHLPALVRPVRSFLENASVADAARIDVQPMSMAVQNIARALAEPPVSAAAPAGRVWYDAKYWSCFRSSSLLPKRRLAGVKCFATARNGWAGNVSNKPAPCWRETSKTRRR